MTQQIQIGARLSPATTGTAIGYRIDTLAGVEHVAFTTTGVVELDVAGAWHVADPVTVPDAGCIVYWGTSGSDLLTESYGPSADVATLAAVAALNDLSAAEVNAEVDTAIADAQLATAANLTTVDTVVDAIKAKTDNLPTDPADASDVASAVTSATSTITTAITTAQGVITTAIAALNNLSAAQVWSYVTRTLTSGGITAADVWAYATRTLTQSAAQVTAAVTGSTLAITRSATFTATLTGLTITDTWQTARFTIKINRERDFADETYAVLQILVTNGGAGGDGLVVLNKSTDTTKADATLALDDDAGTVTITITDDVTAQLANNSYAYDVKLYYPTSASTILTAGSCRVESTPTQTV